METTRKFNLTYSHVAKRFELGFAQTQISFVDGYMDRKSNTIQLTEFLNIAENDADKLLKFLGEVLKVIGRTEDAT